MDKRELIAQSSKKISYSKWEVSRIADVLLENMLEALRQGETIRINGFGKFEPQVRKAYTRLHPKTKKPIHTPEKLSVTFTVSRKFKAAEGTLEKVKAKKKKGASLPEETVEDSDEMPVRKSPL